MPELHQHILEILADQQQAGLQSIAYLLRENGTPQSIEEITSALNSLLAKKKITTSNNLGVTFYHITGPKPKKGDRPLQTTSERIQQLERQIASTAKDLDTAERSVMSIEATLYDLQSQRDTLQRCQADEIKRLQGLQREVAA
jgi:ribosomal protein RSM22 (predicted rRNA methylase)